MTAKEIIQQVKEKLEDNWCCVTNCDAERNYEQTNVCLHELAELSVDQMIQTFSALFMTDGSLLHQHLIKIKNEIRELNPDRSVATVETTEDKKLTQ